MTLQLKTKTAFGGVVKTPGNLPFTAAHDLYGWATVEVKDRDGDIVRVKGINTDPGHSVKLFHHKTTHRHNDTADGDIPTAGIVTEWVEAIHPRLKVPAMAFGADLNREEDGALTKKADDTRAKYATGHLDCFSIGFEPTDVTKLKDGRYDVKACTVFELSTCVVPANPHAVTLKSWAAHLDADERDALRDDALFDLIEQMRPLKDFLPTIQKRLDEIAEDKAHSDHQAAASAVVGDETQRNDRAELTKALQALQAKLS